MKHFAQMALTIYIIILLMTQMSSIYHIYSGDEMYGLLIGTALKFGTIFGLLFLGGFFDEE
jgi:hypothetical protein